MKLIGLFIIFLIISLSFVPAMNNSSIPNNPNGIGPIFKDILINNTINSTNNTTNINNTINNTIPVKTITINFPKFNYLDYFTPVTEIKDPLSPKTWKTDFQSKKEGLQKAADAYIEWTNEVSRIANESYAKGENTYDSGYNTKFKHVPSSVMKSVFEQDSKIDAGFSQVGAYYAAIDARFNVVIISMGIVVGILSALIGLITAILLTINTAATAADVATCGVSAPVIDPTRAILTKTGAAIILCLTGIGLTATTVPQNAIKTDLASKKSDLEKTNAKYQPTHAEAKIESPRLLDGSSNEKKTPFEIKGKNNTNTEQIQIITPGFEHMEKVTVSDINKIKTTALNNLDLHKYDEDYGVKEYSNWNPKSWTNKIPEPVWNPPKYNLPYKNPKWYQFWKHIANGAYTIAYGIAYAAYSAAYALEWVVYGISYVATYLSYAIYWFGDTVYRATYNLGKYEKLSDDINKLNEIFN